jgi:phosphoserine phosphatase
MVSKPLEAVNEFSSALWSDIEAAIVRGQQASAGVPLAVFDADGTLWDEDAGEVFFQWQLSHCKFRNLPADPWLHYREWKKRDPHGAYGWLAQISAGAPLTEVRSWAEECFRQHSPWPVFRSIQDLFLRLNTNGFEVFVVTASVKWAVEPAALSLLGVPPENILGIETEIVNGIVSDRVRHPITYRQGKAEAFLKASGGRRPMIAAGNTLGDIALIDLATDVKLMIQSQSPLLSENVNLLADEKKLRDHGRPLGWRLHAFRS